MTSHGAEYVFVGVADVSGSSTLYADSAFFAAICGRGFERTNATSMVLNDTLPCTGEECGSGVSHVRWIRGLHIQQERMNGDKLFLEVETLLDQLFRHYYTPVHVAKEIIPRFVTSNPSPSHIRSVMECGPVLPPPVAAAPQESRGQCGDGGFKPIALRPVVTSFLVNVESSTGVSAHLHVETMVFVSRDISTTVATVKLYLGQFPSATIKKCDVINVFVDRNGHGSCSLGMCNNLINGDGWKWTHLGTMFLILCVRVENWLHLHKLE